MAAILWATAFAGAACLYRPRSYNIALEWKNSFTWDDRSAAIRRDGVTLRPDEIDVVKRAAVDTLRDAFATTPSVSIGAVAKITDPMYVHNIDRAVLGESYPCGAWLCPGTRINYDLHMTLAQEYAKDLNVTDHVDVLRAIGRGIGNTAAHEFGHRRALPGMHKSSDPRAFTAGGIHVSTFYGPPLYWPPQVLEALREPSR